MEDGESSKAQSPFLPSGSVKTLTLEDRAPFLTLRTTQQGLLSLPLHFLILRLHFPSKRISVAQEHAEMNWMRS